tara:strand:- start:1004 stop:2149 length:1146 start_codon:yes stop_codon:yes gene_type:complete
MAQQGYLNTESSKQQAEQLSDAELAQMLAPIALYPDSLLTHILIASTYPIEIIEAHRWLKNNASLNTKQIAKAIEDFDWDASVKALVPFEQILSRLSDDLSWMQQLGDTFLEDESRVLASIQSLRYEAKHAGNLSKMANMDVSYDDNNIVIDSKEREVVYVPYYDTRMVYGIWRWSSYPPVYWAPSHRVYVNHHNPFHWHSGIRISFNYFFSTFHWHKRHIMVVNPRKTHHYRARKLITHGGYAKPWLHKPVHRRGVSYKNKVIREKFHNKSSIKHRVVKNHGAVINSNHVNRKHVKEFKATRAVHPVSRNESKKVAKPALNIATGKLNLHSSVKKQNIKHNTSNKRRNSAASKLPRGSSTKQRNQVVVNRNHEFRKKQNY